MIKSVMKLDKDDDDDRRLLTERRRVKTGEKKRVFSRKEGEKKLKNGPKMVLHLLLTTTK